MVEIRPAEPRDATAAAAFLQRSLGGRGDHYRRYLACPWLAKLPGKQPNLGHLIEADGQIRGFFTSTYAHRLHQGEQLIACNTHSIAVDPDYRAHTLKLFKAALADRTVGYTCFTASDNAAAVFRFFKFVETPCVRWAVPVAAGLWPTLVVLPKLRVVVDHAKIAKRLPPELAQLALDHRGCAQVLCELGGQQSLVIAIARGQKLRYGETLFVSEPALLPQTLAAVTLALGVQLRAPVISIDARWLPTAPRYARRLLRRPRHVRAPVGWPFDDMLYSELVLRYAHQQ